MLRDGAAAQYGSDAIAGVINFGLKRKDHGLDVTARYGQYYEGDGRDIQLSANLGLKLGSNGGFLNVTGEYVNATTPTAPCSGPTPSCCSRSAIM